jgi:hypothetical protein
MAKHKLPRREAARQLLCFRQILVNAFWVNELGYMGYMGLYWIFMGLYGYKIRTKSVRNPY